MKVNVFTACALKTLARTEKFICIAALISLVLIASIESVGRLFGWVIHSSTGLLTHFLLLLGLFAGMFTA